MEDQVLEKYRKDLQFIEDNLAPFKFTDTTDNNAYEKYIEASKEAVMSYATLLKYRTPTQVIDSGISYKCPVCKNVVKDTDCFCSYCGQKITMEEK